MTDDENVCVFQALHYIVMIMKMVGVSVFEMAYFLSHVLDLLWVSV